MTTQYPIYNVSVADLKVGDRVIGEWQATRTPMLDGYTICTVTEIDGNFIYFTRPHVEIISKQSYQDIYLRHPNHSYILEIHGDNLTILAAETWMTYRDHKGLFYTLLSREK